MIESRNNSSIERVLSEVDRVVVGKEETVKKWLLVCTMGM